MTAWIAIGRAGTQVQAHAMEGRTLLRSATGTDESGTLEQLAFGAGRILRLGDGAPAALPAPILPAAGTATFPGFMQESPPDVIGARVRLWIAGFLARSPRWDGVICAFEDDVTHWIHISADEAVSAQSFLTPQLVRLLDGDPGASHEAVADSLSRPERLAANLRAAEVAGDPAALTGHLIGAELAAARPYWLGQNVVLIATGRASSGHAAALESQGVPVVIHDPDKLLPDALAALAEALGLAD